MMLWTCGRSSSHYDGVVGREVCAQLHAMDLIQVFVSFKNRFRVRCSMQRSWSSITCTIYNVIHTALASVSYRGFGEQANAVLKAGSSLLFQLLTSTPPLHVYKHSMFSSSPLDGASSLISKTPVVGVTVVTRGQGIIPDSEVL